MNVDLSNAKKFLETLVVEKGSHEGEDGFCVMEAVAYVAGEEHTDTPKCASEVIGSFLRSWNDSLNDKDRQLLKPYVLKLVGTVASKEIEVARARLAQDWYVRVFTPTWLELAGLSDHAETLRKLNKITSDKDITDAQPALLAARSAAESAARSAARSAAESAAWSAAWSAARSAAWSAAESAARSAARSAAESAAWSAAWSAARSAAESAAWSAARSAAEEALAPTVTRLQASAFALLDAMINLK
jgi:hypothetical protein